MACSRRRGIFPVLMAAGLLSLILVPLGCGGGGSGGEGRPTPSPGPTAPPQRTTTTVRFTITWDERTRGLNGFSSARSAVVTLPGAGTMGGDVATIFKRDRFPLETHTATVTVPQPVVVGTWPLRARFHTGQDGDGTVVGFADATVTIAADGSGIGNIATVGVITSVTVTPLSLTPGDTDAIAYACRSAAGDIIAVSPGSAKFQVSGGDTGAATVTPDGDVTAHRVGTLSVTATVDRVTSPPAAVTVGPKPAPTPPSFGMANSPWPRYQRDSYNSGQAPVSGPNTGKLVWSTTLGGTVARQAVIGEDGTVYVGVSPFCCEEPVSPAFYALDGKTGAVKWSLRTGEGNVRGGVNTVPVIGSDNTVYFGSVGHVFAVNGATGVVRWKRKLDDHPLLSWPVFGPENLLYVASLRTLYALDRTTGLVRWHYDVPAFALDAAPAVGPDGTVYVANLEFMTAITKNGALQWQHEADHVYGHFKESPTLSRDGKTLYVTNWDNHLYAFHADTGAVRWKFNLGAWVGMTPSVGADGTVYVSEYRGKMFALHGETGAVRWTRQLAGGVLFNSPIFGSDGTLYIVNAGDLVALSGATGEFLWKYHFFGDAVTTPAMGADGTLYFSSPNDYFYAVR